MTTVANKAATMATSYSEEEQNKQMTTIVLADDHKIVRQGIKALLETEPDFNLVGEAADGLEAARLVKQHQPDILIVDLTMPGMSGIEVTARVRQDSPQTKVIVLSMHSVEAYVLRSLEAGATSYVVKESGVEHLIQAVRETMAGRRYLSPPLSEESLAAYRAKTYSHPVQGSTPPKGENDSPASRGK